MQFGSMAPNLKSRTCFAHSLQFCVIKGLEDKSIKDLLSTFSSIVSHFKHSTAASKALYEKIENFNKQISAISKNQVELCLCYARQT